MNSFDIGGCASLLIQQHGEWAEWKATERAVALLGTEDYEGVEAFLLVAEAISRLQRADAVCSGLLHRHSPGDDCSASAGATPLLASNARWRIKDGAQT